MDVYPQLCIFNGLCTFIYSEERIRSGIKKLQKARQSSTQGRLDSFFKVLPITPSPANKRKARKESFRKVTVSTKTKLSLYLRLQTFTGVHLKKATRAVLKQNPHKRDNNEVLTTDHQSLKVCQHFQVFSFPRKAIVKFDDRIVPKMYNAPEAISGKIIIS